MPRITIDQLIKKLESLPGKIGTHQDLEYLARFTKDMVFKRVKSGYGVNSDSLASERTVKKRFVPLSTTYKQYRQGKAYFFKRNGKLIRVPEASNRLGQYGYGQFYSPGKSNLTMTGQMLDSMTYAVSGNGFRVFVRDSSRRGGGPTNAQIAEFVSEQGRPWLALHSGERLILRQEIVNLVRAAIQSSGL